MKWVEFIFELSAGDTIKERFSFDINTPRTEINDCFEEWKLDLFSSHWRYVNGPEEA